MNHPPNILKQLLKSIAKCISETSTGEEIFNKSIKIYSKALKKSGFTDELKYLRNEVQQLENNEGRKPQKKANLVQPTLFK